MFSLHLKIVLFAFVSSFVVKLSEAQTYTFTNAGAEGREGPTQAQIDSNYSNTNLAGKVTISTRGIQEWIVPVSGYYKLEAYARIVATIIYMGKKFAFAAQRDASLHRRIYFTSLLAALSSTCCFMPCQYIFK